MNRLILIISVLLSVSTLGACANMPANATELPLNSLHIDYRDTGNPNGTPIVLIHAFPMNQRMWDLQVEFLQQTARVITFDIRGLGKSELRGPYTLEFIVDDLIALLDQLKIKKAIVCGLSMGGFVALRAAERNPERILGLVLADTKSEPDSDFSKLGRYRALKSIQEQGAKAYVNDFVRSGLAAGTISDRKDVFQGVKAIAESNRSEGVQAAILALTSRLDTTSGLSQIKVPTLILHGELDSVIPSSEAKLMHQKIEGSQFLIVPNAGHLSNLDNPDFFNERLKQFIFSI
jgi:3-oxoadipate enol-lactonase